MSIFKDKAPELFNKGYEVLPISHGTKACFADDWESIDIDKQLINKWNLDYPNAGVGIRLGKVIAIDFDIYDSGVAEAMEMYMDYPFSRYGERPKFLMPFLNDEKLSKKKVTYTDENGKDHSIEMLATGQQFVAYHIHPETKEPFEWYQDLPAIEQLDAIKYVDVLDIVSVFQQVCEDSGWTKKRNTFTDEPSSKSTGDIDDYKPPLDLEHEDIENILDYLDATDYDEWVRVGAALHHQYQGSYEGLDSWIAWSDEATSADNFDEGTCEKKWESFNSNKPNAVTMASLIKETGYRVPIDVSDLSKDDPPEKKPKRLDLNSVPGEAQTLAGFLKRYAYVPAGNSVLDLKRPVDSAIIAMEAFRNLTANERLEVETPVTKAFPDGVKLEPIHKFWLCNEDRLTVEGQVYQPGSTDKLVQMTDGRLWVNTAHFPTFTDDKYDESRLRVFWNHMRYLMPNVDERNWFIEWMAFNIQRPAMRCKVTPLHVSLPFGTGRGWVVECMEKLLGPWNTTKATMPELCGEGSKGQYHDYFDKSLLCCVEEVYEGGKRYTVADVLRDKLTENRLNINLKYGGKGTRDIYTNFMWMTNHNDACVLPSGDRRIYVIQGPDYVNPTAYYDALYSWLENDDNIATLWYWLYDLDLSEFNWKTAEMTEAKQTMIEYNFTPTEETFHEFLANPSHPFMSLQQIVAGIDQLSIKRGEHSSMEDRQVKKLLQKMAPTNLSMQIRLPSGARVRPWALKQIEGVTHDDIRDSVLEAEEFYINQQEI